MSIVIIGTGMAGYNLAREIRKSDTEVALVLVTADGGNAYPKPALSNALIQGKQPQQIISADAATMAERLNAVIHTRTRVQSIDTANRQVITDQGNISYDRLVLATGARPIRLPFKGDAADEVLSVNDLEEYSLFREKIEQARRVAIIGPGLIGCEFANDLIVSGRQVEVIGPDPYPISTLLPEAAGKALQDGLAAAGVRWHLGTVVEEINHNNEGYQLRLTDGNIVMADVILSAIGLKPDLDLAQSIALETNRGIVTDRTLQTSQPGIYALGDCVEVAGLNLPFVMPLMNAARALAKTLTGTATPLSYPAMPVGIKTPAHPIVVSPPARGTEGDWEIEQAESGVRALFRSSQGQLLGFTLTGNYVDEKAQWTKQVPPVLA
ncbi:FAD-dependent oxidoreductase [Sedimenticola selenatireducens]|uniref:FAD-dependent oxidoreductase n=1 Tax=Sedimenticola selenatireducens TaxID=191960 RepID=A0A2N6CT54_9GAMM|nr:FAD-dependent oxidoreductase [Sedimenticola selenatireducens]PLX60300.1 MAG: FAD-dependent oxidoreductase [Sedimenticola selenatireducens]